MADSIIEKIKEQLDIVEVVGGYLKLQKTGINYRALCPFHSEKKPSFFVSPSRQRFKCFGCGESGSVIDFVMKMEGVEFGDALRILAQKAGINIEEYRYRPEFKTQRQRLYEILELSCRFFEKQLQESAKGLQAREYLLKRGISDSSIKKWRLGYAPNKWRALSDFLVGKGYKREEIIKAGLAVENEQKGKLPYDRFRGRIMFPIFDLHSQVIGFGGRILEDSEETAKYLNIPNTLVYDKSRVLYGLNFAKTEIRRRDFAILVEGYTDVIMAHQAGFENTIAVSGTALTPFQLKILKRYSKNLYTSFDMDSAGGMATERGIDLAQKEDFNIKVIVLDKEKDPADIIKENPKQWQEAVSSARDVFEFYFESAFSRFDKNTPEGKRKISEFLLPKIKQIPNKILQSHWVQKLSQAIKVKEEAVLEELRKINIQNQPQDQSQQAPEAVVPQTPLKSRDKLLEERILTLVLKNPEKLAVLNQDYLWIFSPEVKVVLNALKNSDSERVDVVLEKIQKNDKNLAEFLENIYLTLEATEEEFLDESKLDEEMLFCLDELKKIKLKEKLNQISAEIEVAEKENDSKRLEKLSKEFTELSKKLTQSI